MRHIIYIINPISGSGSKAELEKCIRKKTNEAGIPYDIFPSVASGDYSFLFDVIRGKKVTDVVIAGGDGTISKVVHGLMDLGLNFGIIPCGSGNGLAYTAKIPKDTSQALDLIFTGKSSAVDGFLLNRFNGSEHREFACMLCGFGFDAQVAHDFAQQPKRGLTTYVKQVIRNFFAAKPFSFELQLGNTSLQTDAYLISIANSNQFGNNFTIAPKASLSDGLLDIVILTDQNKLSLLIETFRQITGRNKLETDTMIIKKKGVIYFQAKELRIINHSHAPLHIDGDPAETPDVLEILVKKKCFRLIQPH
jgi:YegS/Rv2252/BmrU family lipid kinase